MCGKKEKNKEAKEKDTTFLIFRVWRIKELTYLYYLSLMEEKTVTISSTFPFATEANSNFGKGRGTFPFTDKKKLSFATA